MECNKCWLQSHCAVPHCQPSKNAPNAKRESHELSSHRARSVAHSRSCFRCPRPGDSISPPSARPFAAPGNSLCIRSTPADSGKRPESGSRKPSFMPRNKERNSRMRVAFPVPFATPCSLPALILRSPDYLHIRPTSNPQRPRVQNCKLGTMHPRLLQCNRDPTQPSTRSGMTTTWRHTPGQDEGIA